jgi:hypothetical protein
MTRTNSKALKAKVARAYVDEMTSKFPGIETEVVWEGIDGFDLWIRIELPEGLLNSDVEIQDETVRLDLRFYDETGLSTIGTVVPKVPEALQSRQGVSYGQR